VDEDGSTTANGYRHVGVQNPDGEKSWRGWKNPITARLLCPIEYVEEFKNDPDKCADVSSWAPQYFTNYLLSSTLMKLRQGELRLNDNRGDPKFPAFLYDEDAMNGTFTTGLLRGPLLLAVSSESVYYEDRRRSRPASRYTLPSLFRLLPRLAQRHRQSEGTPKSMEWRRSSPRRFVTQRSTFVETFSESWPYV